MNEIPMTKYYDFRKEVHKLYNNDVLNRGDLSCKILEIRDKYRCVDSVELALQDRSVTVELDQGTSESKKKEITHKIADCIGRYIVDNTDKLNPAITNDPDFDEFLGASNSIFCDVYFVGDTIKFNL